MTVVSVNVGTPKPVSVGEGMVLTSIFKSPVKGPVAIRGNNFVGDAQADLSVHGGPYKAIYSYAEEHYTYWREQLPDMQLVPPMFGENLTTRGLFEDQVNIGDRYRIGSAVLQVSQPRMPCFKLAIRFGRPDILKRFWKSNRPGIYFSVVEEGKVQAGDTIEQVTRANDSISVADVVALYQGKVNNSELMEKALRAPLFGGWKDGLRERLSHRASSKSL